MYIYPYIHILLLSFLLLPFYHPSITTNLLAIEPKPTVRYEQDKNIMS